MQISERIFLIVIYSFMNILQAYYLHYNQLLKHAELITTIYSRTVIITVIYDPTNTPIETKYPLNHRSYCPVKKRMQHSTTHTYAHRTRASAPKAQAPPASTPTSFPRCTKTPLDRSETPKSLLTTYRERLRLDRFGVRGQQSLRLRRHDTGTGLHLADHLAVQIAALAHGGGGAVTHPQGAAQHVQAAAHGGARGGGFQAVGFRWRGRARKNFSRTGLNVRIGCDLRLGRDHTSVAYVGRLSRDGIGMGDRVGRLNDRQSIVPADHCAAPANGRPLCHAKFGAQWSEIDRRRCLIKVAYEREGKMVEKLKIILHNFIVIRFKLYYLNHGYKMKTYLYLLLL